VWQTYPPTNGTPVIIRDDKNAAIPPAREPTGSRFLNRLDEDFLFALCRSLDRNQPKTVAFPPVINVNRGAYISPCTNPPLRLMVVQRRRAMNKMKSSKAFSYAGLRRPSMTWASLRHARKFGLRLNFYHAPPSFDFGVLKSLPLLVVPSDQR